MVVALMALMLNCQQLSHLKVALGKALSRIFTFLPVKPKL